MENKGYHGYRGILSDWPDSEDTGHGAGPDHCYCSSAIKQSVKRHHLYGQLCEISDNDTTEYRSMGQLPDGSICDRTCGQNSGQTGVRGCVAKGYKYHGESRYNKSDDIQAQFDKLSKMQCYKGYSKVASSHEDDLLQSNDIDSELDLHNAGHSARGERTSPRRQHQHEGKLFKNHNSLFARYAGRCSLSTTLLIFSVVSSVFMIIICLIGLCMIDPHEDQFVYSLVVLVNTVFCAMYVIRGTLMRSPYELGCYVFSLSLLQAYVTINYIYSDDTISRVGLIVSWVLVPIRVPITVSLGYTYYQLGAALFRIVGGNKQLQKHCHLAYITLSFLVLDTQLTINALIYVLHDSNLFGDLSVRLTLGLGIPLTVIYTLLGFMTIFQENVVFFAIFVLLSIVQPVYIIHEIVHTLVEMVTSRAIRHYLTPLTLNIMVCSFAAIIVRIALIVSMELARSNFGKGLKERALTMRSDILPEDNMEYLLMKRYSTFEQESE